jgi:hypothetical protein
MSEEATKLNKKVIKDIPCGSVEDFKKRTQRTLELDGTNLDDISVDEGLKLLKKHGMIKDDNIVIPNGFILTRIWNYGGSEYTFNDGLLILDLEFDTIEEEEAFFE